MGVRIHAQAMDRMVYFTKGCQMDLKPFAFYVLEVDCQV